MVAAGRVVAEHADGEQALLSGERMPEGGMDDRDGGRNGADPLVLPVDECVVVDDADAFLIGDIGIGDVEIVAICSERLPEGSGSEG